MLMSDMHFDSYEDYRRAQWSLQKAIDRHDYAWAELKAIFDSFNKAAKEFMEAEDERRRANE